MHLDTTASSTRLLNDYWLARVDGFRRVPLAVTRVTD